MYDGWAVLATIALGFVLATAGTTSLVLSAVYWRTAGVTLLSFGALTFLYGTRLLIGVDALAPLFGFSRRGLAFTTAFIIYVLPVAGLVYAESIRGRGWRSSLRLLWQSALLLAVAFIAYDATVGRPWASLPVYRIFIIIVMLVLLPHVVLWRQRDPVESIIRTSGTLILGLSILHDNLVGFRVLPWRVNLEIYGIGLFILGLGLVTARRFFGSQRELATVEGEMEMARAIQASILPHGVPRLEGGAIAVRYFPVRSVAGDIYDFLMVDERRVGVLVADVTGHSVPAALIASMAKVAFSSQLAYVDDPGRVLMEMNRVLAGHFEARFVTAACVFLDTGRRIIRYSLAGHPPPLLWKRSTGQIEELREGGHVLGLFPEVTYPTSELSLDPGDRLVLYTDGLTDAANGSGEWFGDHELRAFVARGASMNAERFVEALVSHLEHWSGRGQGGRPFDDDLTVAAIDCGTPAASS